MRGCSFVLVACLLCGCVAPEVFRDPASGQTAQCSASSPPGLFPIIANWEVDQCAQAYLKMGWQRQ